MTVPYFINQSGIIMTESTKYTLFVGFRKLGEFPSIREAKQHVTDNKLSGLFSLIGPNYRDSWYVPKFYLTPEDK